MTLSMITMYVCMPFIAQGEARKSELMTVGDVMTRGALIAVKKSTTVDEALEALVDNRITGMPVVDDNGRLIGVVSDYDLLALDTISGDKPAAATGLFPQAGSSWKAFKEIQKLLLKTRGTTVGDVMTPSPLVVRSMTNLEDAARLLLEYKYRRLPVVDDTGKLVGLLTRGNVVRAALQMKRDAEARGISPLKLTRIHAAILWAQSKSATWIDVL
eukprot:SM000051S17548  [mRNA]  locus=s51:256584:259043:+ [translate_table: standard]